jgi:hypothetical protein
MRTGSRSLLREVAPSSHGVRSMKVRGVTADGNQFAYSAVLFSTTLHVVTGVRGAK